LLYGKMGAKSKNSIVILAVRRATGLLILVSGRFNPDAVFDVL